MLPEPDYRQVLLTSQPFWEMLSPTVVEQRIEQLLAAPNSEELIQGLSPIEYTVLLKEAPEMRPTLLAFAHPEQNCLVIDLDCWKKDTLQSVRVLEWLEELSRSGEEVYLRTVEALDSELLIAAFRQHLRVLTTLPIEEEEEPRHYDEVLSNELYRLEFLDENNPFNDHILQHLDFLRRTSQDIYHSLMQGVMSIQDTECTEWAYRWKSGRLQDEGFPDYYDALEAHMSFDHLSVSSLSTAALLPPGPPASAAATALVPTYAWSMTPSSSLLAQALQGEISPETAARLCWEMVSLCNRALILDQVDFADAVAVCTSLRRVHAYINIGLAYLSAHHSQPLTTLLTHHPLQTVCQTGIGLSMTLHRRAVHLQTQLDKTLGVRRTLPSLEHQVLTGLLQPHHPLFFEGLEWPGTTGYRTFLSVQDVQRTEAILARLENDPLYRV
jgi:Family of unknown function (DUF6178)